MHTLSTTHVHISTPVLTHNRSYRELLTCLIDDEDDNIFVDVDWMSLVKVQTVEPVDEFPAGPCVLAAVCQG